MRILLILFISFCSISLFSADYYWVGGSGNWSDISHWAAVSGGTVKYPTVPTSEDNVIFDANSFTGPNQIVTFQNDIIFMRSMDWTGVTNMPRLSGPRGTTINVFGNLLLSPDMILDFQGKILFTGEAEEKSVDLAGHVLRGVMTFAGESTWNMESAVTVDSMIEISRGEVLFNAFNVTCRFFHINSYSQKVVDLRNSTVLISGAYLPEYEYNGNGSISLYIQNGGLSLQAEGASFELSAPGATFYHLGPNDNVVLDDVVFSANTRRVYMTSEWFDVPINIGNLTFNSNALVEGTVNADVISFAGGGRYRFGAERMYSFGTINAMGDCAEGVVITSDNPGFESIFDVTSGVVNMEFTTLRDIHAAGSTTLNANNGVDLGNTNGWDFTNSMPLDFYWIGGSGLWNDENHWSFSSGGVSSGCVPSGKDNAFFDNNSFSGPNQSVALNSNATYIHDLIWNGVTGNPEFTGNQLQGIIVTGSLELDPNMEHDVEGNYNFESQETDNTIRVNGNIFNESITFSGVLGQWRFLDDVEVYRVMYFGSGHVNLDGHQLTMTRFYSGTGQYRLFDISESTVLLRESLYQGPEWSVELENYEVIATNSTIEFTENGNFDHGGNGNGPLPSYDRMIMNTFNSGIRSVNNATDESEPAIYINDLTFAARGRLSGSNHIGTLRLADGYSYVFDSGYNRTQVIDNLVSQGSCESGLTQLFGSEPGNQANISLAGTQTLERMAIQDINVIQGSLINNNSVDSGNNVNMTFNELTSRTLYWVGNGGQWQDPAHWSLSSGGVGGECIPTGIDNVFFDANSFTLDNQSVTSIASTIPSCNDFAFQNTTGYPEIGMNFILVNGSLSYDANFANYIDEHIFAGTDNATVSMGNQEMNNVRFRKDGRVAFTDDFVFSRWTHEMGGVDFGDNGLWGVSMYFYGSAPKELNLETSNITLYDNGDAFNDRGENLTVLPGLSQMTLPSQNVGIFSRNSLTFNKVLFTSTQGYGYIASRHNWDNDDYNGIMNISSVYFSGNGRTYGHVNSDTIVGVAGKIYILDSERTLDVSSLLQLRGNNCTPIELRSSENSFRSMINMPAASDIIVDFVQMKDIEATGGAEFNAGSRSVDVGNSNIGWVFQDAPDFIESGFLGLDRAICENEPVVLEAYSYSPNETYLWSTGSVDSVIVIDQAGNYFVEVQFESNCVLRDTVTIIAAEVFEPTLPEEQFICEVGSALLNGEVAFDDATYLWSNGDETPTIEVENPGLYFVEVEALGCITRDSVAVLVVDDPGSFLPSDTSTCEGSLLTIGSELESVEYLWSDGSTNDSFVGISEGDLWLEILVGTCVFRDSVYISELPIPILDLGQDTSICNNTTLDIMLSSDYQYEWQDGSDALNYQITNGGQYILKALNSGCDNIDTINVTVVEAPIVSLGEDIEVCASEEVRLQAPISYTSFEWDDGSTDSVRMADEARSYWIEVEGNGCFARDTVRVDFISLPLIELGRDTTVCDDVAYIVEPIERSNGDISWQDASSLENYEVLSPGLITATIFDGLCENSDSVFVDFKECTFFEMYIPNAFSPNGDGYNDKFEVYLPENLIVNSYNISIFDRWGSRVYFSNDKDDGWDGTIDTSALTSGVYVYFIQISYVDDNGPGEKLIEGDIAILQ